MANLEKIALAFLSAFFICHFLSCFQPNNDKKTSSYSLLPIEDELTLNNAEGFRKDSMLLQFINCDSTTSAEDIAKLLDKIKIAYAGTFRQDIGKIFSKQLKENSNLYTGRGETEANRIRGYMLASLAEVGPTEVSLPYILGELSQSHDSYILGAASRAAGQMDFASHETVPFLINLMNPDYDKYYFTYDSFNYSYPLKNKTNLTLEVINAFEKLGPKASVSIGLLNDIVENQSSNNKEIIVAAQRALKKFTGKKIKTEETPIYINEGLKENSATFSTPWVPISKREINVLTEIKLQDHHGSLFDFNNQYEKINAVTFFYSSCTNPYKCSETIYRMAELQKKLAGHRSKKKINIIAITLDPIFDVPEVLYQYGEKRGLRLKKEITPNAFMLRATNGNNRKLLKSLKVNANYGLGEINVHGIEMILLDKKGKVAKKYCHTFWNDNELIKDIEILLNE